MAGDAYREGCRRQHRIIAHYLAVQAWLRKLDCIVLARDELEKFLGLQRFKAERVKWLRDDLKPWFPYQVPYYRTGAESSIHSLFLSRVPISKHLPTGSMATSQRIAGMAKEAPPTALFSKGVKSIPDEKQIVGELAVLSAGLASPVDAEMSVLLQALGVR
jgi:hypothetical protein